MKKRLVTPLKETDKWVQLDKAEFIRLLGYISAIKRRAQQLETKMRAIQKIACEGGQNGEAT